MKFIDSNILLRYITGDDPRAQQQAADIIGRIRRGEDEAFTTDVHIHEATYVLASRSLYGLSHAEIGARLRPLVAMRGLKMSNKRICLDALAIFAANSFLDFADALAVATMRRKGMTEVYSFDRDFGRVAGISRIES